MKRFRRLTAALLALVLIGMLALPAAAATRVPTAEKEVTVSAGQTPLETVESDEDWPWYASLMLVLFIFMIILFWPLLIAMIVFIVLNCSAKKKLREYERRFPPTPYGRPAAGGQPPYGVPPYAPQYSAYAPPAAQSAPASPADFSADAPADFSADAPADFSADAPADFSADAPADFSADAPADFSADAPADFSADAPADFSADALSGTAPAFDEPSEGGKSDE